MAFHVRSLGRVFLCAFCLICIFFGTLSDARQSLSIIKPGEWIGTNKTVADVVAEQTGVQTRQYGGTGSFQTVTIRGVQGNEVLVLLDGIPLNSAMGGAVDLGAISPDRIGEIEVYKGITPGEFGGNPNQIVHKSGSHFYITNYIAWKMIRLWKSMPPQALS